MFHLAAFAKSIAQNADTQVDALSDDILFISGGQFLMPADTMLCMAAYLSANALRAQLKSPKLLQTNPLFIRPVNKAATPADVPQYAIYAPQYPVLRKEEQLQFVGQQNGAGAEESTGLVWLATQLEPVPSGDIYTIRATSTGAATANAWTTITYALDNTLPAGTYALVGSQVISTNGQAHRWIIDNQQQRPGFMSLAAETNHLMRDLQYHTLGVMGRFYAYNLPRLQVLCNGGDNSHTIYMDVIKVG